MNILIDGFRWFVWWILDGLVCLVGLVVLQGLWWFAMVIHSFLLMITNVFGISLS